VSSLLPNAGNTEELGTWPVENLVDLAGIEPATSSMPWNGENRNLLTAKALTAGGVGENR
jgi:hypothetical protein